MLNYIADISNWKLYEKKDDNLEYILTLLDETEELDDIEYVCLEVWNTESFVSNTHPKYMSFYKENEFPVEWYSVVKYECDKRNLKLVFVPRDAYTIKKIEIETGNKIFGIHSNDLTFTPLIKKLSSISDKLFMWVGNNEINNIESSYKIIKENYKNILTIIHNQTEQDTTLEDACFARIDDLRHMFKGNFIGYHSTSELTDAITLTNIATAMGCNTLCFNYGTIELNKDKIKHVLQSNNTVHKIVTTSPKT
ncbi:MAG: N-acetylneuraminate synthase family protein [Candidatus Pacebacteria bacterium]|nr:N-acetylneuraminate synthase family protein [Candidatus Paceibacterota bacterium]